MRGTVKNVTVALDALGWHIAFACEIAHQAPVNICPAVGIDRGVDQTSRRSGGRSRPDEACRNALAAALMLSHRSRPPG